VASPNRDERPPGCRPELIVLHYTGMATGAAARERLCDPAAKVSAHWFVDVDGTCEALVPEAMRAWHAGRSVWRGRRSINDISVGIEIVNPGHGNGYRPFPERQIQAVIRLCQGILARHGLMPAAIVAHSDIAPDRKLDPGEAFPWRRLAAGGVGIWPEESRPRPPDPEVARDLLGAIGYGVEPGERQLRAVLAAFQRRFRPWRVDGRLDADTMGRLEAVAAFR
jgi:N-acetylmuramoyl-L-alanine amidase